MGKNKTVADAEFENAAPPATAENTNLEPVDFQQDEYRGHGGSYIFDPQTGKRTKVDSIEQEG